MSDFALKYNGKDFDLSVEKNDLATDDGLQSAVIISLFTDKRVRSDELPFPETDRSGWWGDMVADLEGDEIGSKLWLLRREKQTSATLLRYEEYAKESLQWLIEDGIAETVGVTASFPEMGRVDLVVTIQKPQGKLSFKYSITWSAEKARG